jgi:beta-ureidopropionase / N-carbamoyl-L-amino-acid hydrolase
MSGRYTLFTINISRLREDFFDLSQIGKVGESGVNRPAFSIAHLEARSWFRKRIEQAGLEFRQDEAGNTSGFLRCGPPGAPTLLLGSHLDSVPTGGRFDGALGVLAGLEALRRIHEESLTLPFHLEVIDFSDEEGSLVNFFGSFALVGLLEPEHLENPRGGRDKLSEGLQRAGLNPEAVLDARRDPASLAGYLELHIEQGSQLITAGMKVGVVSSITGLSFYRLIFLGRADHAGTAPVQTRKDAGVGASYFNVSLRELIVERYPDCVANVGIANFEPGAFNIVPEKAVLSLEFRSAELSRFQSLKSEVLKLAEDAAARFGLRLVVEFLGEKEPLVMNQKMQGVVEKAAEVLGLPAAEIVSRAGHDAQAMAAFCPTGMIFVPSEGGISHSPNEFTQWEDCVNGANVMLNSVLLLAENS